MSHPRVRLLPAWLAVVVIALFTLPGAVSAAPPEVETITNEGTLEFQGPCANAPEVTLVATFRETLRVTTFFAQDGTPVRLQIKIDYFGVVTNPVSGASVEDNAHQMVVVDLVEGTETVVGLKFSSTVPGVGVVFHDVGRLVFDSNGEVIFEAGPHDVLNTEGEHPVRARFCEALT